MAPKKTSSSKKVKSKNEIKKIKSSSKKTTASSKSFLDKYGKYGLGAAGLSATGLGTYLLAKHLSKNKTSIPLLTQQSQSQSQAPQLLRKQLPQPIQIPSSPSSQKSNNSSILKDIHSDISKILIKTFSPKSKSTSPSKKLSQTPSQTQQQPLPGVEIRESLLKQIEKTLISPRPQGGKGRKRESPKNKPNSSKK